MSVDASDIKFYLSGGAANSNVNAAIGGAISSVEITTATLANLFDTVSGTESAVGDIEYRCFYVKNTNGSSVANLLRLWISTQTTNANTSLQIGLAIEGENVTATAVADENTAPVGVIFASPTDYASGLYLGDLAAGHYFGIWVKWTVVLNTSADASDQTVMTLQCTNSPGIRNTAFPFDQDSVVTMRNNPKKVWAHWHFFPISVDDVTPVSFPGSDYYGTGWLNPSGESGSPHLFCGGFIRDRPLGRAAIGAGYVLEDMKTDVRNAIALGCDGFMYNVTVTDTANWNWTNLLALLDAASAVDPGFKIIPNIDAAILSGTVVGTINTNLATIASHAAWYKLPPSDNRKVISVFQPESWTQAQLDSLISGNTAALVLIFNVWTPAVAPVTTYGYGSWGAVNTTDVPNTNAHAVTAHAAGKIWVAPVRPQYCPYLSLTYYEASASGLMRAMVDQAMTDTAEWVFLATWNDYAETSHLAPSCGTQYAYYDVLAYYLQKFKNAALPDIRRDVLFYFHRIEKVSVTYTDHVNMPDDMTLGSGTAEDSLEVLAFLVSAGSIEVDVNGTTYTFAGVAGINSFRQALAGTAKPVFRLKRNGVTLIALTSGFDLHTSVTFQDFNYRGGGSNRAPVALIANPP